MADRISRRVMLERASSAVGKIDMYGLRGTTMVTVEETEAMALALVSLGLIPTLPGTTPPRCLFEPDGIEAAMLFTEGPGGDK